MAPNFSPSARRRIARRLNWYRKNRGHVLFALLPGVDYPADAPPRQAAKIQGFVIRNLAITRELGWQLRRA